METIIPLIIMLIVGSLFRKKKEADEPAKDQPKPFTAQEGRPNDPIKKLTEMSKEMYRELQKEMQQAEEQPRQMAPQVVVPPKPVEVKPAMLEKPLTQKESMQRKRVTRTRTRSIGRTPAPADKRLQTQTTNSNDLMPKSEKDLIKGVIFSEIFGPPKSKQ